MKRRHFLQNFALAPALLNAQRVYSLPAVLGQLPSSPSGDRPTLLLDPGAFRHYVDSFNENDIAGKTNYIDNGSSWEWLRQNIPFFECADKGLEEMYYFRWWTFRKHIEKTPEGFVITEFLPDVPWAGKFNTINASAVHHFYEGRWVRDPRYLADYARFWFRKEGNPRLYSFPAADAIRAWSMVTQDQQLGVDLFPDLVKNYQEWEKTHQDPNGLFWQVDDRDGMEDSIGGSGYRPTINSYMFGDAMALSDMATWVWPYQTDVAREFRLKADTLRELVEQNLWDETMRFYKTLPRGNHTQLVDVRELIGYVPWYYNLPNPGREAAWKQLMDPQGFYAAYGPTTAERRHPRFMFENPHECLWNGPSWPFATSQTLTAMANLLNNYRQNYVSKQDFLELLRIYARSQHLKRADGKVIPFIDEDLNPDTGEWLARSILYKLSMEQSEGIGGKDRGRDYNHSTFNDLIITGLVGLRPRLDQWVEVNPLAPADAMPYFCLEGVRYHGCNLTILYDETGERYRRGQGLHVFADGQEIGSAPSLTWLRAKLPQTAAGWKKYAGNPLIGGGKIGTVFDIAVLRENGKYRMWGSWRPKSSLALFVSADGIHWSDPEIVFSPEPATQWEDDINRPCVLKRADGYHLWYTGQAKERSEIGYATSPDGRAWKRMSGRPVLSPELPWEKGALMCPNVLWDEEARLFRMWYCGGDQYEPDAIGYATSPDGLHWSKHPSNPVFKPLAENIWEQYKVAGAQVLRHRGWYYIAYIGYRDIDHAQIGIARSSDGITNWVRHPQNPIIRPGQDEFDQDACYKPYMLFDGKRWLLWYNGRHGWLEQIALVLHDGEDLGFDH
jgi:predicted GH43/DUF377 family glycosyl hydrolase